MNLQSLKKVSEDFFFELLPENADCCLADLFCDSTGVILPDRELKFGLLIEEDLPSSNGVIFLFIVFPYKSSISRSFQWFTYGTKCN